MGLLSRWHLLYDYVYHSGVLVSWGTAAMYCVDIEWLAYV